MQTTRVFLVFVVLLGVGEPAWPQADTSSYNYPAGPSMLDTLGKVQQLELQRQQIEMQRMQIEQQRLQMQQSEQRQLEFGRQQAASILRRSPPASRVVKSAAGPDGQTAVLERERFLDDRPQ